MKTFLGEFTLDPADSEFKALRSVCEPGNPWRCLIGTAASMNIGKRVSARVDHEAKTGVIGVTEGDYRFERPMTPGELRLATDFDLGKEIRKPLKVTIDLGDGTWTGKPKARTRGGAKTAANNYGRGPKNRQIRSLRQRQLAAIVTAHAKAGEDLPPQQ